MIIETKNYEQNIFLLNSYVIYFVESMVTYLVNMYSLIRFKK
ncbi:hypothetical protein PROFFT_A_00330 [Candidatus Profftia tarda]|uniref:Uncharacterized protein n=1 Tax=Candidatus Profftia tarda TaxID=1177216 RepID=A0A8E4EXU6_9ENTR|nr:hypothetical protein PROFFT_A_00330 [Candidatus Profftia tarda]